MHKVTAEGKRDLASCDLHASVHTVSPSPGSLPPVPPWAWQKEVLHVNQEELSMVQHTAEKRMRWF